ncbi:RNA polymerase sigma factor [Streptomyces sp. NPDC057094]|uniref:RNA polymerase sigma factor n=1 Tax=Streptomyces sp. NPDC057094 TaxID=3346018 RepID=UPI00362EEC78
MVEENVAEESIEAAYQGRRPEMLAVARRLLADAGIPESKVSAEDVVQNACLKALQKQQTTRIAQSGAYIYAVIRNQVRDEARRSDNATLPVPEYDSTVAVRHAHPDPAEQVHQRIALLNALRRLSPSQRRIVWMTRHMGYTHAEAARRSGVQTTTASMHALRGTIAARAILTGILMMVVALGLKVLQLIDGSAELASTGRTECIRAEDLAWGGLYCVLFLSAARVLYDTMVGIQIRRPLLLFLAILTLATQIALTACSLRLVFHVGLHPPGWVDVITVLDWLNAPPEPQTNAKLLVVLYVLLCGLVRWRDHARTRSLGTRKAFRDREPQAHRSNGFGFTLQESETTAKVSSDAGGRRRACRVQSGSTPDR